MRNLRDFINKFFFCEKHHMKSKNKEKQQELGKEGSKGVRMEMILLFNFCFVVELVLDYLQRPNQTLHSSYEL